MDVLQRSEATAACVPARLKNDDWRLLAFLKHGPFVRRCGGWRFGTRRISDTIVDRLIAAGRAKRIGNRVEATGG